MLLTRLARTASDASGKGDAEHDPERLPSSQFPTSLRLQAYPSRAVRKDNVRGSHTDFAFYLPPPASAERRFPSG